MIKKPNTKMIGIFTFCGIMLFLLIFSFFLHSKLSVNENDLMVMYFKESIQGLKIGSPVVFRGVEIGKVAKIDLEFNENDYSFNIPVYITLHKNNYKSSVKFSDVILKNNIKARLATYSFITGQLMIELETLPNIETISVNNKDNKLIEIPTVLSSKGELSQGLKDLPLKNIIENFDRTLTILNKHTPTLLVGINDFINNVNNILKIDENKTDNVANNLNSAVININELLKSARNLVDYLERHPESLLKGKGGY